MRIQLWVLMISVLAGCYKPEALSVKEPVQPSAAPTSTTQDPTPLPTPLGGTFLALGQPGESETFHSEVTIFRTSKSTDCPNCVNLRVVYDGKYLRTATNARPVEQLEFDFTDACPYLGRKTAQTFRDAGEAPRAPITGNIDIQVKMSLCDINGLITLSAKRHPCDDSAQAKCKKQEVVQSFTTTLADLLDLRLFTADGFPNRVVKSGG